MDINRLSRILQDDQAMLFRNRPDRGHIAHLTKKVDRHDCLGPSRNRRLNQRNIDIVGLWVNVNKDRRRARLHNCLGARHKGERRRNDLVARTNARRVQHDAQCIGATVNGDRVPNSVFER